MTKSENRDCPVWTVRVELDGGPSIEIGPRSEVDLGVVFREAWADVRASVAGLSREVSDLKPRFACTGRFVELTPGLLRPSVEFVLAADIVAELAAAGSSLTVRLARLDTTPDRPPGGASSSEDDESVKPKGTMAESNVYFRLNGSNLRADLVTKRVGLRPTRVLKSRLPFRADGTPSQTQWLIEAGDEIVSDLRISLDHVLEQVAPRAAAIMGVQSAMGLQATIEFLVHRNGELIPPLTLASRHLVQMAELGAGIWLDVR